MIAASKLQRQSLITCPICGHQALETMPVDACQYFYDYKGRGGLIKAKSGDCCVFCSFGTVPCPPVQQARANGENHSCCDRR